MPRGPRGEKRPADVIGAAVTAANIATGEAPDRAITSKQMGDAGEMLVAAELTLRGIPAFIVPGNWPSYDVVAQTPRGLERISVKTRTFARSGNFVGYGNDDEFDWFAIVILPGKGCQTRRIFI